METASPDYEKVSADGPTRLGDRVARVRSALAGGRALWFGLGVLIALVATVSAFVQPLRPDALRPPRLFRLQWWLHPIESNAFARIPRVTQDPLRVFALRDGKHVWAAGGGGLVLRSEDGGRTWSDTALSAPARPPAAAAAKASTPSSKSAIRLVSQGASPRQQRTPPSNSASDATTPDRIYPALVAICFANQDHGWVAGTSGAMFHTTDGGRSWSQQRVPSTNAFTDIACVDLQTVWALNAAGLVFLSVDGGDQWVDRKRLTSLPVSIAAPDSTRTVAITSEGAYSTADGGQSWNGSAFDASPFQLRDVAFGTTRGGWTVGEAGTLYVTHDAGATWRFLVSSPEFDYHRIAAIDSFTAVVSAGSVVVRTTDAFETIQVDSTLYRGDRGILDVAFADRDHGWAVRDGIQYTSDGGRTWALQLSKSPLAAIAFRDSLNGLAVGEHGLILATADGGRNWKQRSTTLDRRLEYVAFLGDTAALALPRYGPGLVSTNDGRTWRPMTTPRADTGGVRVDSAAIPWFFRSTRRLAWVSPLSPSAAVALDEEGNLVRSSDAGQTWTPIDSVPRRWPAPWYYLALVLSTTVSAAALRKRSAPALQKSIADVLVSDRPWRPLSGDRDALGFRDVARGIAQFLANRRTQPPLTIAIIGAWGTGKTSLMNMLHHDLRRRRFYPIWFNAWHHQREESLLAALFEGIRQQGIPPIWAPRGIKFRLKLLRLRLGRYAGLAAVVIALGALGLGYFLSDPDKRIEGLRELIGLSTRHGEATSRWEQIASMLTLISAAGGLLVTYLKGIRPFGREPRELLTQLGGIAGIGSRAGQTGFRYAFAKDFKEVADALKPHPMVIFVDDLDRCRPDQVMEVLESINFLQTCGDVVIVVGMDRERVIGCVGFAYKDVAADLVRTANADADTDGDGVITPQEIRADFARQYLEKLINIEVPVPIATVDGLGRVMANRPFEPETVPDSERDPSPWIGRSVRWTQRLTLAAALAILFGVAYQTGGSPSEPPRDAAQVSTDFKAAGTAATGVAGTTDAVTPFPAAYTNAPARVNTHATASVPRTVVFLPILLLVGVLFLALRNKREVIVDDSDTFRDAMNLWGPFLFQKMSTPRSAKKFTNRVRFLAMLQRRPRPAATALQRLHGWSQANRHSALTRLLERFGISQPAEPAAPSGLIPEDRLVTLSVLRECQPTWIEDERLWNDFGSFLAEKRGQLPPQMEARIVGELSRWGSLAAYRDRFTALTRSVRVH